MVDEETGDGIGAAHAVNHSYVSHLGGPEVFRQMVWAEASRRGWDQALLAEEVYPMRAAIAEVGLPLALAGNANSAENRSVPFADRLGVPEARHGPAKIVLPTTGMSSPSSFHCHEARRTASYVPQCFARGEGGVARGAPMHLVTCGVALPGVAILHCRWRAVRLSPLPGELRCS